MGDTRHRFLAVAGVALAASGVTVIALAVIAGTPPLAGSGSPVSVVSTTEPPLEEDGFFRLPPSYSAAPEEVDDDPFSLPSSEPAAIEITAIGVESKVQQVGLTAEKTMEVPAPGPHYDEAAWYKHSVTPGEIGPSVIVGHVDSAADGPSVFYDLGSLSPRDEIRITRRDGTVAIFSVESVRQYPKDEFPTDLVYGETDQAALRLITCGGTFDRGERSYQDNVIVFATLLSPTTKSSSPMTAR